MYCCFLYVFFFIAYVIVRRRLQRNPRSGSFTESDMNDQHGINENLLVFSSESFSFLFFIFAFVALIIYRFEYIPVHIYICYTYIHVTVIVYVIKTCVKIFYYHTRTISHLFLTNRFIIVSFNNSTFSQSFKICI